MTNSKHRKVYLDHAATTPVDPEVVDAMLPYFTEKFGNPSSVHQWGREAGKAVDQARETVAEILNCKPEEIIFTGSTSEADNIAILGTARANRDKGTHLVTSPVEHHAALDEFKELEKEGFKTSYLKVDQYGLVDPSEVQKAITPKTVLVNVIYVNNEVGTIEPIQEIAQFTQEAGIPLHTDAAAAVKHLELDVQELGVDLMTLGAQKFYGPKGVGILYIKEGTKVQATQFGGHHEKGLRPGTENVPAIVGTAKALELVASQRATLNKQVAQLRDRFIEKVLKEIPDSKLTGHPEKRSPEFASFLFKGAEGEAILLRLNAEGIAASSGSACTSGELKPSHVLLAMGIPQEEAHGSIRFSLGKHTTQEDIDYTVDKLTQIMSDLRKMSPTYEKSKFRC